MSISLVGIKTVEGTNVIDLNGNSQTAIGDKSLAAGDAVWSMGGFAFSPRAKTANGPIPLKNNANPAGIYFFDSSMNMVCLIKQAKNGWKAVATKAKKLWKPTTDNEWLAIYPESVASQIYPTCNFISSEGAINFFGGMPNNNWDNALTDGVSLLDMANIDTYLAINAHTGLGMWQTSDGVYRVAAGSQYRALETISIYSGGLDGFSLERAITKTDSDLSWFTEAIESSKWDSDAANAAFAAMQSRWTSRVRNGEDFYPNNVASYGPGLYNYIIAPSRECAPNPSDANAPPAPLALYHSVQAHGVVNPTTDDGTNWEELGICIVYDNPLVAYTADNGGTTASIGQICRFYKGAELHEETDPNTQLVTKTWIGQDDAAVSIRISPTVQYPPDDSKTHTITGELKNITSDGITTILWLDQVNYSYTGGLEGPSQLLELCLDGTPCGAISPKPEMNSLPEWCCGNVSIPCFSQSTLEVEDSVKVSKVPSYYTKISTNNVASYAVWFGVQQIGTDIFTGACASWNKGKPVFFYYNKPVLIGDSTSLVNNMPTGDETYLKVDAGFDGMYLAEFHGDFRKYGGELDEWGGAINCSWMHKSGTAINGVGIQGTTGEYETPIWMDPDNAYCITDGSNLPMINVST